MSCTSSELQKNGSVAKMLDVNETTKINILHHRAEHILLNQHFVFLLFIFLPSKKRQLSIFIRYSPKDLFDLRPGIYILIPIHIHVQER